MSLIKNIKAGSLSKLLISLAIVLSILQFTNAQSQNNSIGKRTDIKILDKISTKNELINLINGEELIYKDLAIKSMKCTNSEFDDNPEIIAPFDHPVYDIWLVNCY